MNLQKRVNTFFIILFVNLFSFMNIFSSDEKDNQKVEQNKCRIESWYVLGPALYPLPGFHENAEKGFDVKKLTEYETLDLKKIAPASDSVISWFNNKTINWQSHTGFESIALKPVPHDSSMPQIAYLATYLNTNRWMKVKINITCCQLLKLYLNGTPQITKTNSENESKTDERECGEFHADLKLETGKHLLIIKTIHDPAAKKDWAIKADLEWDNSIPPNELTAELTPLHFFQIEQLLDGPKVNWAAISPNGQYVACQFSEQQPATEKVDVWIEIRQFDTGRTMHNYRGNLKISNFQWAPIGNRFAFTSLSNKTTTLWIMDLDSGSNESLLTNIKDFVNYTWAPSSQFIIYSTKDKVEKSESGIKRVKGLPDRWPTWRDKNYLYQVTVPEGITRRLTVGELSTGLETIHPDGKSLLFTRIVTDYENRPYSKTELYQLNLEDLTCKLIWEGYFFDSASWSPDGQQLLVLAGPSTFGELGLNIPPGMIPNDYDTQAYIFDIDLKKGEAITKKFNPTITQAVWSQFDGKIYFNTLDSSYQNIYCYHPKNKTFRRLKTAAEVVHSISLAKSAPRLVYTGESVSLPLTVFGMEVPQKKSTILAPAENENLRHLKLGKVEDWYFRNARNIQINGQIYYPPNFDPSQKYPCIVYYYGGTNPVTRSFGGRYPKNLWAAQGYIIYVLQPSGATGFGQAFSALHVNDWGQIVVDEIIEGVRQFLKAHQFINSSRVGCIGASFGGFITQLLLTRTDMFRAAVAHAGISAIASYWGEGYWGYLYSAVATANSFPWNRKDIYVDQSPLFSADKINTPLLLTHGIDDTNVPPGESEQLYVALKLLGKEVEYLKVEGQNHVVMNYSKRKLWTKSIVAWFDKWLKGQPEFWNELYHNSQDTKQD